MVGRALLILLCIAGTAAALDVTPLDLAGEVVVGQKATYHYLLHHDGDETAFIPSVAASDDVTWTVDPPIVWLSALYPEQIVTIVLSAPSGEYAPRLVIDSPTEHAEAPVSFVVERGPLPPARTSEYVATGYLMVAGVLALIAVSGVRRGVLRP